MTQSSHPTTTTLRLILGDQLSHTLASLKDANPATDTLMLVEVREEATYVKHHPKKIAFLFSAMRHFAQELQAKGFTVRYTQYDDPDNAGSFWGEVARACQALKPDRVVVVHPGEYRVWADMQQWEAKLGLPVEILPDDRFLCDLPEFNTWAHGKKQLRMEFFYREMRRKTGLLMQLDGEPEGGQWNYDVENRKPAPKTTLTPPAPFRQTPDAITQDVLALVAKHFTDHFGELEPFTFAVTREQALAVLQQFIDERLPKFGDYQDIMLSGQPWLYHAHIGFYLNCGLLVPMECLQAAQTAYAQGKAPLSAVEGFIRQILGWREYVRGLYWLHMPGYAEKNHLQAERPLPDLFWSGDTDLNCLKQCITETKQNAYAHHIQRLMVLGNFLLLAGVEPKAVQQWYLAVYADAYEWVELPNVNGMILFADGGIMASKPYAAGGAYINKMSNYCQGCRYKVAEKTGPTACPFNYLYWDFLHRHDGLFRKNPRMGMVYKSWDRFTPERQQEIQDDARTFLASL
jgi:deoxyribodipyrimidine photolyase-related protein